MGKNLTNACNKIHAQLAVGSSFTALYSKTERKKVEQEDLIDPLCAGRHFIFRQPTTKKYFSSTMLPECFPPTQS